MKPLLLALIRACGLWWCRIRGMEIGGYCMINGIPGVTIKPDASIVAGTHLNINSATWSNPLNLRHGCRLFAGPGASIRIGDRVGISACRIVAKERIEIGDGSLIGPGVLIYDSDGHALPLGSGAPPKTSPVLIGKKVLIGTGSTILKGVTIGDGAVIGANSLVNRDIPPGVLAAGNPARVIRPLTQR